MTAIDFDDEVIAPARTGLSVWERIGAGLLSLGLLVIAVPKLGSALWKVIRTWLATGEVELLLPTSFEIPYPPDWPRGTGLLGVVQAGFDQGYFVVQNIESVAHAQLTIARALTALMLLLAVVLLAVLAFRVALNRSVFQLLVRGTMICGVALALTSLLSNFLLHSALGSITEQILFNGRTDAVFAPDFEFSWLGIGGGIALVILSIILKAAERNASELREVI